MRKQRNDMAAKQSDEKKSIRVKDPDKYEYAYLLYMQKVPQKDIADRVGVSQQTVVKWKDDGGWELKRVSKTVSRDSMVDEYSSIFDSAVSPSISKGVESGVIPDEMKRRLDDDVYLFSGFKTYHELKEASSLLRDNDGQLKPFNRFYNDISAIKQDYNKNWLQAEYIFATQSSVMAAKWKDQEAGSDRYNLQYRTAGDSRVRPEHRVLDKTTLPASNPFWNEYYPPNGWRCRCTVVQVRKGKYPETDSNTAMSPSFTVISKAFSISRTSASFIRRSLLSFIFCINFFSISLYFYHFTSSR